MCEALFAHGQRASQVPFKLVIRAGIEVVHRLGWAELRLGMWALQVCGRQERERVLGQEQAVELELEGGRMQWLQP